MAYYKISNAKLAMTKLKITLKMFFVCSNDRRKFFIF